MSKPTKLSLWKRRIAPVFERARMEAGKAAAQVDGAAAMSGSLGGSRSAITKASAIEEHGSRAVAEALRLYDLAAREAGAPKLEMQRALHDAIEIWITTFRAPDAITQAFGGSYVSTFNDSLDRIVERLRARVGEHLIQPSERRPLSVSHPILSRGLDAAIAAVISAAVTISLTLIGFGK